MGFNDLTLVKPHDLKVLHRQKVIQRASGAMDVLTNAQTFSTLDDAVDGFNVVCGTGMPFDMYQTRLEREYVEPRIYFDGLISNAIANNHSTDDTNDRHQHSNSIRLALVFGSEKTGMPESDMDTCHVMLGIPTNPQFGSLNLAAAVQLIAYDWRVAIGGFEVQSSYQ
jgi:tRNA/rRNA methyltransferase